MTPEEREAFLADIHVGVLAIEEPGRGPLALPIWYLYRDGEVRIGMDASSVKARLLTAAGRATLTVQSEVPPYQYVSVEGPVVVDASSRDELEMATRYLGPELGRWYADNSPSGEGAVLVRLVPERWRTKDYGKLFPGGTDAS
jgi:nitroimidazol reductase NimA-like FMN-containing flavoprotein (pyridoxamine 5'-phosphate oxidase superfamily)